MGLDDFISSTGDSPDKTDTNNDKTKEKEHSTQQEQEFKPEITQAEPHSRYEYVGDQVLEFPSTEEIESALEHTDYDFERCVLPVDGITYKSESGSGKFIMVLSDPTKKEGVDCLLLSILESENLYDVVTPYKIFPTPGWGDKVQEAISTVKERKGELRDCPRCGSLTIIKKTNNTSTRIRGCSTYPDCRYNKPIELENKPDQIQTTFE